MSEKGKPDWTRHDFGAFNDMRLTQIRAKFGLEGYGLFWFLVEELGKSADHKLGIKDLDHLAFACHMPADKIQAFLVFAVSINLFDSDGNSFFSHRLNRELDKFYKISQTRARAGKKGGKQKFSNSLANAKQMPSHNSTGHDSTGHDKTKDILDPFSAQFNQTTRTGADSTWPLYVAALNATKSNVQVTQKGWRSAFTRLNPTQEQLDAIMLYLTEYARIANAANGEFVPHLPAPDKFFDNEQWTAELPKLGQSSGAIDWSKIELK